ncbi:MAG: OmpA family protein [Pseudomonadota bacterium]
MKRSPLKAAIVFAATLCASTLCAPLSAFAQTMTVVEPFAGSANVGRYAADFDQITVLVDAEAAGHARAAAEGAVRAMVLTAPEDASVLEVARSFEQALTREGFEILFSRRIARGGAPTDEVGLREWVRDLEDINGARDYQRAPDASNLTTSLQRVYAFPAHYLAARRVTETEEIHFALTMEDTRNHYLIEQVSRAVMADDNVSLTEESLSRTIETEGRAVLYGVQFDVNSSVLRPSSRSSIETIAAVLRERSGRFYIVGHTSDTGGFQENMRLSEARAASIIAVLGAEYGVDVTRLQPIGVGPAAPLASNQNEAGRQLNRRVELVERLD